MSNLTDGLKLITALGDISRNAATGDWTASGLGMFADAGQLAILILKNTDKFGPKSKKFFGGDTAIIDVTISLIDLLELLCGFESPDEGDAFTIGSLRFTLTYERLASAFPDNRWQGAASEAYAVLNADQRDRANALAEVDTTMADIVQGQAGQVEDTRRHLALTKDSLTGATFVALALLLIPPPGNGKAISQGFQVAVSVFAMFVVLTRLSQMAWDAVDTADRVKEAIEKYNGVAAAAVPTGTPFTDAAVAAASGSRVSSFADISNSLSRMQDVSRLADAAGERASSRTGDGDSPGEGSPGEPSTPETPAVPPVRMPTLSRGTLPPGEAADLAVHSRHVKRSGRVGSPARQVTPQDEGGRHRAPEPREAPAGYASLAGNVQGAQLGAASGRGHAERAPVDVPPVGTEEALRATPAERAG